MKWNRILLIVICAGFLSGCKKEAEQSPLNMTAGAIDANGYYLDFQPDIVLKQTEVSCLTYSDSISIDLNGDAINDVLFLFWHTQFDLGCQCCGDSIDDYYPTGGDGYKRITVLNDSFQISSDSLGYVLCLDSNTTINESLSWNGKSNQFLLEFNNSPWGYFRGNWNHTKTRFMGYRFLYPSDTLYGWIRLKSSNTITITDLALEAHH